MLQAMNTGHEGSMTTVHANTTRDALARSGSHDRHGRITTSRSRALRQQIASALQIVVQARR